MKYKIFNNSETSLNNQTARDTQISGVTGYNSGSIATANNPYFNADGTLKDATQDFGTLITNAPDETTKRYLEQARDYKVTMPEYSQYAAGVANVAPTKNRRRNKAQDANIDFTQQGIDLQNKQLESNVAISKIKAASGGSSGSGSSKTAKPTLTPAQAQAAFDKGVKTPQVLEAMDYYYGTSYSGGNSSSTVGPDGQPLSNEERVKKYNLHNTFRRFQIVYIILCKNCKETDQIMNAQQVLNFLTNL